jgi:hypothetical protein
MIDPSAEKFTLKLLPDSDVPWQLSELLPDAAEHLEALCEALNADRARSFLIPSIRGQKESFLLCTPRHRVRLFEDRYDAHTGIILNSQENTFYQWEEDRKKGTPCSAIWTTHASQSRSKGGSMLDRAKNIRSKNAPA